MSRVAMCRCGEPLVMTLHWARYEFYCLSCGKHYGFLDPTPADETPELLERVAAIEAEWNENAGRKLLTDHAWIEGCDKCEGRGEYHVEHATQADRMLHADAVAWIEQRKAGA